LSAAESSSEEASLTIAQLEARVAALEAALERRSEEVRRLQRELPERELVVLSRLSAGLPPGPATPFEPDRWRETAELTPAEVEETLTDLWRSLRPREPVPGERGA